MARSVLGSFVSGTRQVLIVQLFISVGAVALAGWTLGVTNDLIRERNRLKERVIQLEETLAAADVIVPPTADVIDPPRTETAYPPSVNLPEDEPAPEEPAPSTEPPAKNAEPETPTREEPGVDPQRGFNPGQILTDLFAPPPPLRTVVLHARTAADARVAQGLARELMQAANVRVAVDVMQAGAARESTYSYFDGRQSRAAAALMQQFHDIARRNQVAAWSAQLRGVALPAQGEFTADRLDIVLPPLRTVVNPNLQLQMNPRVLQQVQPQTQQPTIR